VLKVFVHINLSEKLFYKYPMSLSAVSFWGRDANQEGCAESLSLCALSQMHYPTLHSPDLVRFGNLDVVAAA
jgi:hypothetical protein